VRREELLPRGFPSKRGDFPAAGDETTVHIDETRPTFFSSYTLQYGIALNHERCRVAQWFCVQNRLQVAARCSSVGNAFGWLRVASFELFFFAASYPMTLCFAVVIFAIQISLLCSPFGQRPLAFVKPLFRLKGGVWEMFPGVRKKPLLIQKSGAVSFMFYGILFSSFICISGQHLTPPPVLHSPRCPGLLLHFAAEVCSFFNVLQPNSRCS
jgi:hypothetical protein